MRIGGIKIPLTTSQKELRRRDPKECVYATPYLVNNGVVDCYYCEKFAVKCYFNPKERKSFIKVCEGVE